MDSYASFLASFNSAKFAKLRDSQAYILATYEMEYGDADDVAIELPTGAGKTLIALLIAERWRREGKTVAILTANKTLARQMESEATQLGIPAVRMEGRGTDIPSGDKRAYQRARKVAIMNYWVYFNQNPSIDPADFLIMDDAHLAEHCLHSLYSVEIDRQKHAGLFKAMVLEIKAKCPEYLVLDECLADEPSNTTPTELLSFIDQVSLLDVLKNIVDSAAELDGDADLRFRWLRLRNSLSEGNIYISRNSFWIRPYIYPLINNSYYTTAEQRIYMSATIGDPADLSRRLGIHLAAKIPVPDEFSQLTTGRRFIVLERTESGGVSGRMMRVAKTVLSKCPKSVWMCTSESQAASFKRSFEQWLENNGFPGHQTWLLTSLGDEIEQFKTAPAGHLFVAGRFDGMDFCGDECRLVVLPSLPRAINIQEDFICAYLRDSGFMKRRLNQRIVQALGRCNRSRDDFAVYVLADSKFATHFGRESNRRGIPRNICAEIDMAEDLSDMEISATVNLLEPFLDADFTGYDAALQETLSACVAVEEAANDELVEDEVVGWTAMFASQNYAVANQSFAKCWQDAVKRNLMEIGAYYGWCTAKAIYLASLQSSRGPNRAFTILQEAIDRGGRSAWFNRMRVSLSRAQSATTAPASALQHAYAEAVTQAIDDLLERKGTRAAKFDQWYSQLADSLASEHHNEYTSGVQQLGQLLGFTSRRPKHASAADCEWRGVFGNSREIIVIESKIEHTGRTEIVAEDVGQAHNQINRARSQYENAGYSARGIIVTHLTDLTPDAESAAGEVRILAKATVTALLDHFGLLLREYRSAWAPDDINARSQAAGILAGKLPSAGWLTRALSVDTRFVSQDDLLNEWPH